MTQARALADEYWAYHRSTAQLWNIDRGDVEEIERWEDLSAAGVAERTARLHGFVARADDLRSSGLADDDATLAAAVSFSAGATAATLPWLRNRALVCGPGSFLTFLSVLVPGYALVTERHGEGYLRKLAGTPSFVDSWIDGLRDGLAADQNATARGVAEAIAGYDRLLAGPAAGDPLAGQDPPSELSARARATWTEAVIAVVERDVRPAVAELRLVLRDELLPRARGDDEPGLCHLPGGDAAYARLLWAATSTEHDAEAVHEIGLARLAELDDEYRLIGAEALAVAEPAAVRERLRADPTLRYDTTSEIVDDVHAMIDRARHEAPRWFGRLPSSACNVTPVDAGAMAYYTAPSPDGQRGGTFYFNADPQRWTRFSLPPTTFHEAIPGHHLQLALAQELDLHPVLGELEVTAYGEGWGLYAERLADEMGLYANALQRLGMLTLDSLRASRLVVDTGIHARGWSRARAVAFLHDHTALTMSAVEAEIDRYIADPGQAVSYMVGRLELERLRAEAAARLGGRFSIRAFHDVVLQGGMTPLGELARRIERWVASSG